MDNGQPFSPPNNDSGGRGRYAALRGIAIAVVASQLIRMVLGVVVVLARVGIWLTEPAALTSGEAQTTMGMAWMAVMGLASLAVLAAMLLGCPLWMWWHHRAGANLEATGRDLLQYGALGHVGWWFVPIANIYYPWAAMIELYRASEPVREADAWCEKPVPAGFGVWWGCYLLSGIITWATVSTPAFGMVVDTSAHTLAALLGGVATVLYVRWVWRISKRQEALSSALQGAP